MLPKDTCQCSNVPVESLETWGQAEILGVSSALDQGDSRSLVSGTFFQSIDYKYVVKSEMTLVEHVKILRRF